MGDCVFGLHVGNSSLCIAFSKDGKSEVIANDAGERVTPAVFTLNDKEKIVGQPAKQGIIRNVQNTILRNKDTILKASNEQASKTRRITGCEPNGGNLYVLEDGTKLQPLTILSEFFNKLYETAKSQVKSSEEQLKSVLTLPHDCPEDMKGKVLKCAEDAGFSILRTISEPSAAALVYGIGEGPSQDFYYCVFRAGGYSCDVTIYEAIGGISSVRSHVSRHDLGGEDFTHLLVDYLASDFKCKWKCDPREGRRSLLKLYRASEVCKHVLSSMSTASTFVESLYEGIDFSASVSRVRYESVLTPVLGEMVALIDDALTQANITKDAITKVILSGGTSKTPKVQSCVAAALPQAELLVTVNPDEVIALGAADQAAIIHPHSEVTDRIPALAQHIFFTVNDGEYVQGLQAGTPIPSRRTVTLSVPGGDKFTVRLWQGPSSSEAVEIVEFNFQNTPEGDELNVNMNLASDGSIHVTITDASLQNSQSVTLYGPEE